MQCLVEIGSGEEDFLKFVCIFAIALLSPIGNLR